MDDGRAVSGAGARSGGLPRDLLAAAARLERALADGDERAAGDAVEPGGLAVRDGAVLVAGEGPAGGEPRGERWPRRVHVRALADGVVAVTTEAERRDGGAVLGTRVWRRGAGGTWCVALAHASAAPPPPPPEPLLDEAVWSVAPPTTGALLGGALEGPLAWVRVAVQDVVAVAGHRVGAGVPAWLAQAPLERTCAPALQRLLDAGADVVGVAQTGELGAARDGRNPHYGAPANPAAPGRTTGGAGGGVAAAVASGSADVALGSDAGGSLRVPGAWCGLHVFRPTHGTVPVEGVLPVSPSSDAVGLLARDGRLLHAAARALLGRPAGAPDGSEGEPTALLRSDELTGLAEPATAAAVDAALLALAVTTGLPVEEVPASALDAGDLARWERAAGVVADAELWHGHGRFLLDHPGALGPEVERRLRAGAEVGPDELARARADLDTTRVRLRALLGGGRLLALPTTSGPAPSARHDGDDGDDGAGTASDGLHRLPDLAGLPALVLPWGRTAGLPVGLSVVAGPRSDDLLLQVLERTGPARELPA
ncbi:amidase family protein [uncultured Pseudokineococcus sp.]|uniref:amidase family protein n=1 Tax=uncultured Pseudokineococcus sp. TaxID=1642928 RepID=UPI0026231A7A|nr:amidase family protein [uncultured Pseudokineococcus sp.]